MQRGLISIGLLLLFLGLLWPWLQKLGLFRLPGDIVVEKENMRLYFPITSAIIISLIMSIVFWILSKW